MSELDDRARKIFEETASLPLDERDAFLRRVCADHAALRARVDALLAGRAAPELQPTVRAATAATDRSSVRPGTVIFEAELVKGATVGGFELLRELGEGAFGYVWLARQREPFERDVALKLLKYGLEKPEVVARFEAEQQALALMDHPYVARVYDGGTTDRGRPYL